MKIQKGVSITFPSAPFRHPSIGNLIVSLPHFTRGGRVGGGRVDLDSIYAIPYIFSTTLLLYKLHFVDTLLLKQMNFPVLDITGFFFRIHTQVTALVLCTSAFIRVLMRKKKPVISNTPFIIRAASFVSIVLYPILVFLQYISSNCSFLNS